MARRSPGPAFRESLESLGLDTGDLTDSFVGVMGVMLGVVMALYACWRIGAARTEDAAGRLELTLGRPVSRWHWLGGHLALTAAATTVVAVVSGLGLWIGAATTGADVTFGDAMAAMLSPCRRQPSSPASRCWHSARHHASPLECR